MPWSAGDGPIVEGPAEPLLMAIAGRRRLDELGGPGQPTRAARVSADPRQASRREQRGDR